MGTVDLLLTNWDPIDLLVKQVDESKWLLGAPSSFCTFFV